VVACRLGNLYKKEHLISRLLAKSLPDSAKHIKSLRDVRDCNVQINEHTKRIVCPITCVDLDGGVQGRLIWSCGCVLSERAMKNIRTEGSSCLSCGKAYVPADVVPLIPTEEEAAELMKQIESIPKKKSLKRKTSG